VTRLVVHVGTHTTDWAPIQQQLVSWRDQLERLGVYLHPEDTTAAWTASCLDLAGGATPEALDRQAGTALQAGAEVLLLGAERLEDTVRDPAQLDNLTGFARRHGMPLTVVAVIRDQLGYLNQLYCDRVMALQMARDFDTFVSDPQPAERFAYDAAYGRLISNPDVEFVAVPYASLTDQRQARSLLEAAGISAKRTARLPPAQGRNPLPGPVLVAATRLLFKRMWRMGMIKGLPRARLLSAADELRRNAVEEDWDEGTFWGWGERVRAEAIARYLPGNDAFAQAMWGRMWGDVWANGTYVDVDLAASPPPLVVDILRTADALVKDLQRIKTAEAPATEH
jgi:hypothetical protein